MKRSHFYLILFFIFPLFQFCSNDNDPDKEDALSLELVSSDVTSPDIGVDFTVTSYTLVESNECYDVAYSLKISNNSNEILDLEDYVLQAYLIVEEQKFGAGGILLRDLSIPAKGSHTIEYSFNSCNAPDGLAIDGKNVQLLVYKGSAIITLEYLIHLD